MNRIQRQLIAAGSLLLGVGCASYDDSREQSEFEKQISRLSPAKADPDPAVRHATTQLVMRAQAALARSYFTNASRAPEHAITRLRDAAEAGDTDSQKFLARCYLNGAGVEQDELEAYKWFALAAKQGSKSATEQRDALLKKFTTAQIAEAKRRFNAAHTRP